MKKAARILIAIILTASIILGVAWYLLIYDRDFTRDVLLQSARYFDVQGQHAIAASLYDLAYNLAGDNDAVAIELAMQHKADGNYTQAEATLSRAIEDGGGISLYVALCKTYIEQDKILDAVKLLNGITNPEMKAQLEQIRPAAPTVNQAPGFYNQYISVSVEADAGTLYVNRFGEYPSIHDAPYSEPIVLVDGENTLYAVAVADNGLVSPLSVFGYTIGGVIEEIEFADSAFEAYVRQLLGIDEDVTLFSNDLWGITSFVMPAESVSYADLRYMPFLEELTIINGVSGQLNVLSGLAHLHTLNIVGVPVSSEEFQIISSLPKLERLTLNDCGLSTVSGLENLTNLTYLDLSNNTLRNISYLSSLKKLTEVYLQHNVLTELGNLAGLASIKKLDISYNTITDLSPISDLPALKWLDAGNNQLTNATSVARLSALEYLNVSFNKLESANEFASLTELTELNISNNLITDISALDALNRLQIFNFANNQVAELPSFSADSMLISINGSHNLLEELKQLSGLAYLNNVTMDYNENIKSVDCLANCPVLVIVNVFGTKVTEVESLTDQSIVVNYNPVLD